MSDRVGSVVVAALHAAGASLVLKYSCTEEDNELEKGKLHVAGSFVYVQ